MSQTNNNTNDELPSNAQTPPPPTTPPHHPHPLSDSDSHDDSDEQNLQFEPTGSQTDMFNAPTPAEGEGEVVFITSEGKPIRKVVRGGFTDFVLAPDQEEEEKKEVIVISSSSEPETQELSESESEGVGGVLVDASLNRVIPYYQSGSPLAPAPTQEELRVELGVSKEEWARMSQCEKMSLWEALNWKSKRVVLVRKNVIHPRQRGMLRGTGGRGRTRVVREMVQITVTSFNEPIRGVVRRALYRA